MDIIEKILEYINLAKPSLASLYGMSNFGPGWIFGVFGAVAVSLYGLSVGRTRAVLSLLSVYVAFVFDKLFPYLGDINELIGGAIESYWIRIGVFITAYVSASLIFNFSFIKKRISSIDFSLPAVILITFLQIGFLTSIILSFLPESLARSWSFGFYQYFSSPLAYFLWAVLPIGALLFIKKK